MQADIRAKTQAVIRRIPEPVFGAQRQSPLGAVERAGRDAGGVLGPGVVRAERLGVGGERAALTYRPRGIAAAVVYGNYRIFLCKKDRRARQINEPAFVL